MVGKCTSWDFGVVHGSTSPILLQRRERTSGRASGRVGSALANKLVQGAPRPANVGRVAYIWAEWANYLFESFVEMVLEKRPNGGAYSFGPRNWKLQPKRKKLRSKATTIAPPPPRPKLPKEQSKPLSKFLFYISSAADSG
ncbi:hypothetical protein PIB30_052744 [Stylosanthes scabra]|uniref:Uncharacterized protein n=1 Tax=Stylosanthes scabra TaxID=79078 RepID=A0ABU6VJ87_9FABA|nr:hypothetical protein [Stylosanthes scabra]